MICNFLFHVALSIITIVYSSYIFPFLLSCLLEIYLCFFLLFTTLPHSIFLECWRLIKEVFGNWFLLVMRHYNCAFSWASFPNLFAICFCLLACIYYFPLSLFSVFLVTYEFINIHYVVKTFTESNYSSNCFFFPH